MGSSHRDHIGPSLRDVPDRVAAWVVLLLGVVCAVLIFGLASTWPGGSGSSTDAVYTRVVGEIASSEEVRCHPQGTNRCARIHVDVGGERVDLGLVGKQSVFGQRDVGESVVLGYEPSTGAYFFLDLDRRGPLALVGVLFVVVVVAFARWRGVRALVGLALSVVVLVAYTAPSLLDGRDALGVCVLSAAVIAVVSMLIMHGVRPASVVAIGSILGSLGGSFVLGALVFPWLGLSGATGEEAVIVQTLTRGIDLRGLLLGGTLIGALGALDDVVITQIATVYELSEHRDLRGTLRGAMRVGREHVGAAVNTLVLAYIGAGMPLLLLFAAGGGGIDTVLNGEEVAAEIARALVGSVGLVLAVPMATVLGGIMTHRWGKVRDGGALGSDQG